MPKIITKYGNGHVHVSVKGDAIEIAWGNTGENIAVRPVTRITFEEIFSPLREATSGHEGEPSRMIDDGSNPVTLRIRNRRVHSGAIPDASVNQ